MSEAILIWQAAVAVSIIIARIRSTKAMVVVAWCWTLFTFAAVWAFWLIALQLLTAWGTVWLLSKIPAKQVRNAEAIDWQDRLSLELQATKPGIHEDQHGNARTEANASATGNDVDQNILKRLIDALMTTGQMNEDTKDDLNRILSEARAGLPDAADFEYVKHLHARILGKPATTEPLDFATRNGRDDASYGLRNNSLSAEAAHEDSSTLDKFTRATVSAIHRFSDAVGRLDAHVSALQEKQIANFEIERQLRSLGRHLEAALELGQAEMDLNKRFTQSAPFQVIDLETPSKLSRSKVRLELKGVTLLPTSRDSLPAQAADERLVWLEEAKSKLDATSSKVLNDKLLLAAVDSHISTPFEQFLFDQTATLDKHILYLNSNFSEIGGVKYNKYTTDTLEKLLSAVDDQVQDSTARNMVAKGSNPTNKLSVTSETNRDTRPDQINRIVDERQIPHLVHFTRCENLPSIIRRGIMSVSAIGEQNLDAVRNDLSRFDGQLDGVSLSVAYPNYRMFYKYRQATLGSDWAILLISTRVLWQLDCAFYCHNAADSRMIRQPREHMKSAQALNEMFNGSEGREAHLRLCDPTDSQAEIMVYETIDPKYFEAVAFETREARNRHISALGGLDSFYAGPNRGLFATRSFTRAH